VGIEGDIRVLSLQGYLRIEDLGSNPRIAADAAILDPRSLSDPAPRFAHNQSPNFVPRRVFSVTWAAESEHAIQVAGGEIASIMDARDQDWHRRVKS
jgi:hypothetical protein